jgi:dipeptidyl-peptidase-4
MMSLILAAAVAAAAPSAPGNPLTPERVFSSPALSGPAARGVEISPDGKWVTFLKPEAANHDKLDLWAAPVAGGEPRLLVAGDKVEPAGQALTEAEKNRRERQRLASVSGVIDYHWDDLGKRILIPAGGDLYSADAATGQVARIATGGVTDPKTSPTGRWASFVRDQNLILVDLATGQERPLTTGGKGTLSYGMAEFVAQEEMDRYTGYWWAPGDAAIAYARVDESTVDLVPRLEVGADGTAHVVQQRYPKAGRPNVKIALFVQGLAADAKPVQIDLGADPDIYLARVAWSADGRDLYVQRETRDQKTLDLLRADPATGRTQVIIRETQEPWIDLNDDFYALKDGTFIWGSERSGANHLYLYDRDGKLIRPITHGAWPAAGTGSGAGVHAPGVVGVDEAKGLVYFMASKETPIERQLYVVSYKAPGEPKAVTQGRGWWTATMPKSAQAFVGYYSDSTTPPQTALYDAGGKRLRWIEENRLAEGHPFFAFAGRYPAPEFGVLKSADGQDLHYILQRPVGFDPARRYPAIVQVYGGPGVQSVTRGWRGPEEKLYLEAGYVLFQLDNRGSANRDVRFRSAIDRRMGAPEVDDQVTGIEHLRSLAFVDPARIGVSGWSYGGYMTLRMLTDPRTKLAAGAAGAPPTDWREYDTHYTERYMGMPQTEAAAYDASAVTPRLNRLSGRLLLMQGMADDNVQLSNSIAVMGALQGLSKPFDLMLFPGQRHGIGGDARRLQLWRTYLQFFARELGGAEPPHAAAD